MRRMADPTHIVVRGARERNLRGFDLSIPHGALVVFTGVSGSGKSSLVYDTIYQEGQRRYLESLSAYARQFLGRLERPRVDAVEGLSPTLAIDQKTVNRNPRSTVGTLTEIYDHLRLLMARLGTAHCTVCGAPVRRSSVDEVVDRLEEIHTGVPVSVLAPVIQDRKGEHRKLLQALHRDGWVRARIDGTVEELASPPPLDRHRKHTIEVVVDRVRVGTDRQRLADAVESAAELAEGTLRVVPRDGSDELLFALHRACPKHPEASIPELEPQLFSFNAPRGACPSCAGLGRSMRFEVLDPDRPLPDGFLAFNEEGRLPFTSFDRAALMRVVELLGAPSTLPTRAWPPAIRERLLRGDPSITYTVQVRRESGEERRTHAWEGLLGLVEQVWRWTRAPSIGALGRWAPCSACGGARLNPTSLAVTFRGRSIADLAGFTVEEALGWFERVELAPDQRAVGAPILTQLVERLRFLQEVGLGYLGLDRPADTLSGGEAQRIRLASQVGSPLQGVTYILDEPSIGLHPRDNERLLAAMRRLRDRGNTVLVVEHDTATMLAADRLVDIGPGAGSKGGALVATGSPAEVARGPGLTAAWLRGERRVPLPRRRGPSSSALHLENLRANNLKGFDLRVPLERFVVVTGVSGSGKSSLVFGELEPRVRAWLQRRPARGLRLEGHLDKLVRISQSPIGRTPRSNPATYTGLFEPIRGLFASTPLARERGWTKSRFSFNLPAGRCSACGGAGVRTVQMQILPDVQVRCAVCDGKRYNAETLEVRWRDHTIHDVLALTVDDAASLFENHPAIVSILSTLQRVGLGYLPLGQPSTTLSGGEAQRIKLASELRRRSSSHTLYLLDEPTTGLHPEDVATLIAALQALVEAGNTVVVVEHHTDVIKVADHVIDLGPEGGVSGGGLVGEGPPETIARLDTPTGRVLRGVLHERPPVAELLAAEAPTPYRASKVVTVRGARRHNLKGVDVTIPHGSFTVFTGPSGSGKSSLAFHTLFTEGQRRYVESLSTYARRFLAQHDPAPVDRLEGLQPAIAIEQRRTNHNPRSTVATVTEIHDVLRVLYAHLGQPHCPQCGEALRALAPSEAARILADRSDAAGWLCAPLPPAPDPDALRERLLAEGWTRALSPKSRRQLAIDRPAFLEQLAAGAWIVVDRFHPGRAPGARVAEAIEQAYALGGGAALFIGRSGFYLQLHRSPRCAEHGFELEAPLTPQHFSFNSQRGACPSCEGLGQIPQVVPERLFPGTGGFWSALDPRATSILRRSPRVAPLVEALLARHRQTLHTPPTRYPDALRDALLHGDPKPLSIAWSDRWGGFSREVAEERPWPGLLPLLQRSANRLGALVEVGPCAACGGSRLRPEVRAVTWAGLSIDAFLRQTIEEAHRTVEPLSPDSPVAVRPLEELRRRLGFLVDVGLPYLTLDRPAHTLSGGEAQRIRLASQLGSGLVGVTYVLDEPTVGLHPRDTDRLLHTLRGLRDQGNTILAVEHDPDVITQADRVVDLGPGAGVHGGTIVAEGTPEQIGADPRSVTGPWLTGARTLPHRTAPRTPTGWLTLHRPRLNNLRLDTVRIPLGVWVGVSGVSGSGKSSLVMGALLPALRHRLQRDTPAPPVERVEIDVVIRRVVPIDASPLGTSPRSTPATVCKIGDPIRQLFASLPGSRARGWKPGRFSWNSPRSGRCPLCEGRGANRIEMHFLPDVWVRCTACGGSRFGRETLEVRYGGKSIADVLNMRVDEALGFFCQHRRIARPLQALADVGLGYLRLGQPTTTLSGGEAQRVKLAAELVSRRGHTVYLLDEPTTGLHPSDVAKLLDVLDRLVARGHTVITIEHHPEFLLATDWVLDLGPEGGEAGGSLVGEGPPDRIASLPTPTGRALAKRR